jgi:hypothetical protein
VRPAALSALAFSVNGMEAERVCGLEIDHMLKFDRRHLTAGSGCPGSTRRSVGQT